jgi:anti-anti-sigma factor
MQSQSRRPGAAKRSREGDPVKLDDATRKPAWTAVHGRRTLARDQRPYPEGPGSSQAIVVTLDDADLPQGLVELRSAVVATLRSGARTLVVDVSRLDRMSSHTVTALLWAQRRCRVQGGAVVLRGAGRRCRRLLRRTGLADVFELEPAGRSRPAGTGDPEARAS